MNSRPSIALSSAKRSLQFRSFFKTSSVAEIIPRESFESRAAPRIKEPINHDEPPIKFWTRGFRRVAPCHRSSIARRNELSFAGDGPRVPERVKEFHERDRRAGISNGSLFAVRLSRASRAPRAHATRANGEQTAAAQSRRPSEAIRDRRARREFTESKRTRRHSSAKNRAASDEQRKTPPFPRNGPTPSRQRRSPNVFH